MRRTGRCSVAVSRSRLCYIPANQIGEKGNVQMGSVIVTGITFGVFMTEALIHYNMGVAKAEGQFRLRLPPPKDLVKIAAVTGAFSIISGLLIKSLPKDLAPKV
jgi:hypothetical protein